MRIRSRRRSRRTKSRRMMMRKRMEKTLEKRRKEDGENRSVRIKIQRRIKGNEKAEADENEEK